MTKKIKNVVGTAKFQMFNIASQALPEESFKVIQSYAKGEVDLTLVMNSLPEWFRNEMDRLGTKDPLAFIDLKIDLGALIYELYLQNSTLPEAPLARALKEKKNAEYAEELSKEEFELPVEVRKKVLEVITTDDKWNSFIITCYSEVEGENVYLALKTAAFTMFSGINEALLEAFMEGM